MNLAIAALAVVGSAKGGGQTKNVAVSQDLSYGLSLAMFSTMISPSRPLTGLQAQVVPMGVLQKAAGQVTPDGEGRNPSMAGEVMPVEDVLP